MKIFITGGAGTGNASEITAADYGGVVENYADSILRPKVVGLQSGRVYDLGRDLACASIIIP